MEMARLFFLTKVNKNNIMAKKKTTKYIYQLLPLTVKVRNFGLIQGRTQPSVLSPEVQRLGRKVYHTRHVVLRLRMSGATPSLHKYAFMVCARINVILPL
jgi:hypothetical protein